VVRIWPAAAGAAPVARAFHGETVRADTSLSKAALGRRAFRRSSLAGVPQRGIKGRTGLRPAAPSARTRCRSGEARAGLPYDCLGRYQCLSVPPSTASDAEAPQWRWAHEFHLPKLLGMPEADLRRYRARM